MRQSIDGHIQWKEKTGTSVGAGGRHVMILTLPAQFSLGIAGEPQSFSAGIAALDGDEAWKPGADQARSNSATTGA